MKLFATRGETQELLTSEMGGSNVSTKSAALEEEPESWGLSTLYRAPVGAFLTQWAVPASSLLAAWTGAAPTAVDPLFPSCPSSVPHMNDPERSARSFSFDRKSLRGTPGPRRHDTGDLSAVEKMQTKPEHTHRPRNVDDYSSSPMTRYTTSTRASTTETCWESVETQLADATSPLSGISSSTGTTSQPKNLRGWDAKLIRRTESPLQQGSCRPAALAHGGSEAEASRASGKGKRSLVVLEAFQRFRSRWRGRYTASQPRVAISRNHENHVKPGRRLWNSCCLPYASYLCCPAKGRVVQDSRRCKESRWLSTPEEREKTSETTFLFSEREGFLEAPVALPPTASKPKSSITADKRSVSSTHFADVTRLSSLGETCAACEMAAGVAEVHVPVDGEDIVDRESFYSARSRWPSFTTADAKRNPLSTVSPTGGDEETPIALEHSIAEVFMTRSAESLTVTLTHSPTQGYLTRYAEAVELARACCGKWVTILDRSESLDAQYRLLGMNFVKRAVMNRLAVPVTMFLENDATVLHAWIHTPLGIRHMRMDLLGRLVTDEDPDAGIWEGITRVVNFTAPGFPTEGPVRALQQVRYCKNVGFCVETRCVLADLKETKILLLSFAMIPQRVADTLPSPFRKDGITGMLVSALPPDEDALSCWAQGVTGTLKANRVLRVVQKAD